ncbi:hypothetical protein HPB51_016262 [Rhipicephalus microplus]|uniref:Uncharacterized protein n=1 Tax=Rhipicephalus microplus TaxID=6941 RepID=A0A9J6EHS9_RHIMP|nr:hypothetical protein HPB51_016262 [Rhipicephalus microplus]
MASPESCVLPADVPLPEDMDLQTSDDLTASVTSPTSTNNSAADTMPSRVLLLPDTNPFAPLRELEEQNSIEGKSENTFHQARIISTAPNGEKRARGSLIPTPERQHTSIPRDHSHMRSARHTLLASASYQNEEDGWIPVSYRRKQQNHAAVAVTPSSGAPRAYQHTVILRPKQPCRIMDEQFIRLDRVITRRISAHLNIPEEDPLPEFRKVCRQQTRPSILDYLGGYVVKKVSALTFAACVKTLKTTSRLPNGAAWDVCPALHFFTEAHLPLDMTALPSLFDCRYADWQPGTSELNVTLHKLPPLHTTLGSGADMAAGHLRLVLLQDQKATIVTTNAAVDGTNLREA